MEVPVECLICAEPCRAICVFACGHSTCYSCGLHIHTLNHGSCPICRKASAEMPIITQYVSKEEEQYSEEEMTNMRKVVVTDRKLQCVIDSPQLAMEMSKLYEYLCPVEGCWKGGRQDPFIEIAMLKDHLKIDHDLAYCEVCLQYRPAFLCEQYAYNAPALQRHQEGTCLRDRSSFTGHPPCRFCKKASRFYDGEALLKHMQQQHYTCDVCNRGQFTFTFYATRQKLDQHFQMCHKICDHPDCANLDLMMRVFGNEIDLMVHKQRVHGVKTKATFSPAMFGEASSGPSGAAGSAPATASNANVIQITFDHVFRVETVEMMPTRAQGHGRGGGHGHGGGAASKIKMHAPADNGIPPHYMHRGSLPVLMRRVADDSAAAVASAASSRVANKRRGNAADDEPNTFAFGVAEDMSRYNSKNRLPTDKKELDDLLKAMLDKYLTSPVLLAHFRGYTRDFIESRILTSEYYDVLAMECFPDPDVFHEVFPLLVATVPVAAKKAALQEVYKMRMAPETLRIARAREEDARKEAEAQAAAARAEEQGLRSAARQQSSNNTNSSNVGGARGVASPFAKKNKAKPNAWATVDSRSKLGGSGAHQQQQQHQDPVYTDDHSNASSPTGSAPAASMKPQASNGQRGWASPAASSSPPPAAASPTSAHVIPGRGLVINEENFPSLPNNGVRRSAISKKQQARPNAWFSK
jgi:E3 ubiquitin-protein ligase ZNF598